jgi:hypothetical protein
MWVIRFVNYIKNAPSENSWCKSPWSSCAGDCKLESVLRYPLPGLSCHFRRNRLKPVVRHASWLNSSVSSVDFNFRFGLPFLSNTVQKHIKFLDTPACTFTSSTATSHLDLIISEISQCNIMLANS